MAKVGWMMFLCAAVLSVKITALQAQEVKTGFVQKMHKYVDGDARYAVFVPKNYKGDKEFPVILCLHGADEVGTDGEKQTKVGLGKAIRDKKENFPFIVAFPQGQKEGWNITSDGGLALGILDEVQQEYKTDRNRVYLTGFSKGGSGVWHLAERHPSRWAAISPICGVGQPKVAKKIKDIPCWCFHGEDDDVHNVVLSRSLIGLLKNAGGDPKYTEYPKTGHNCWDKAYATAELYTWFLKHSTK